MTARSTRRFSYQDFPVTMRRAATSTAPMVEVFGGAGIDSSVTVAYDRARFFEPQPGSRRSVIDAVQSRDADARSLWAAGVALADIALPAHAPVAGGQSLREQFVAAIASVRDSDAIRLRLHVSDPELAALPWEFIALPQRPDGRLPTDYLALRPRVSIVRTLPTGFRPRASPRPASAAARVVGVLSAPVGSSPLDVDKDREAIARAVEALAVDTNRPPVTIDWVEPATVTRLTEELSAPADVFHFAGHGSFRQTPASAPTGVLEMQDTGSGAAAQYEASKLGQLLQGSGVRLALLGACSSATSSVRDEWSGVAAALADAGVPAVVGNQAPISDAAASILAAKVYEMTLRGDSVDQAVADSRKMIFQHGARDGVDWGVPVLYLVDGFDGVVFSPPAHGPDPMEALRALLADHDATGTESFMAMLATHGGVRTARPFEALISEAEHDLIAVAPGDRWPTSRLVDDPMVSPYKPFVPFTFIDRGVFFRNALVAEAEARLRASDVLVVSGTAQSGKTSLLMAGVVPKMLAGGGFVVRTSGLTDSAPIVHRDLDQLGFDDGDDAADITSVVARIEHARFEHPPIWIVDNMELELDQAPEHVEDVRADLELLVAAAARQALQLVLVVRDEFTSELVRLVGARSSARLTRVRVPLLSAEEAVEAMTSPTALPSKRVRFQSKAFASSIVDHLGEGTDEIQPAFVEVLCDWLWTRAVDAGDLWTIGPPLGEEGVDAMLAKALDRLLEIRFDASRSDAVQQVLASAELLTGDEWARPDELDLGEVDITVIEELVRCGLLRRRRRSVVEYRHASPAVHELVERSRPSIVRRRREAHETLRTVTLDWYHGQLPSVGHVRFLASVVDGIQPNFEQTVLLLRASVAWHLEAAPWAKRIWELDRASAGGLVRLRDGPGRAVGAAEPEGRLLGLGAGETLHHPGAGPYTVRAISATDRTDRLTAGLVAVTHDFGGRVGAARFDSSRWRRAVNHHREIQVRAAALEAGVLSPEAFAALGLATRVRVRVISWLMHISANRRELGAHGLRVGLLAGAAVGVVQGITEFAVTSQTGVRRWATSFEDASFFFVRALLLGAALAIGLVLPRSFGATSWRSQFVVGCTSFALAALLTLLMVGVVPSDRPAALVGMVAAGLLFAALASMDPPARAPRRQWLARDAGRAAAGASGLVAIQFVLRLLPEAARGSLPVTRTADYFFDELFQRGDFPETRDDRLYLLMSLANAAATGAAFLFAILVGRRGAHRALSAQARLETRAPATTEGAAP